MTAVALALAITLLVTISAFVAALESQRRQHARREDLLIAQLLHAVGKPWIDAPADEKPAVEPDREPRSWQSLPEQYQA